MTTVIEIDGVEYEMMGNLEDTTWLLFKPSSPKTPPKELEWEVKSYEGLKRIVIDMETTPKQHKAISEAIQALMEYVYGDGVDNGQWPATVSIARKLLEKK